VRSLILVKVGMGVGLGLSIAGVLSAAQVGNPPKLPVPEVVPPAVQEVPKTLPPQPRPSPVPMRISQIKPQCMVSGKPMRIVGQGFGKNQGSRRARIGAQDIAIDGGGWDNGLIRGRLPGGLQPGQDYTVAIVDDRGRTLARGRTRACELPKTLAVPGQVLGPSAGERVSPSVKVPPKSEASRPPAPPPVDGKALLEQARKKNLAPRAELGQPPAPMSGAQTPPPAGLPPRLSVAPPAPPKASLPAVQVPGMPKPTLTPQKELGVAVAPRKIEPLPDKGSGFGAAATQIKQQRSGSASQELVGGVDLRINGSPGPTVTAIPGDPVNLNWSMVTQIGERVDRLWLVMRESALPADVCDGNPERSYLQIPAILGDGAQNPAAPTGSNMLDRLTADTTYYLRLCARTEIPGEGLAWRGASNPVTLDYRQRELVPGLVRGGAAETAASAPDLEILSVETPAGSRIDRSEVVRMHPSRGVDVHVVVRNNGERAATVRAGQVRYAVRSGTRTGTYYRVGAARTVDPSDTVRLPLHVGALPFEAAANPSMVDIAIHLVDGTVTPNNETLASTHHWRDENMTNHRAQVRVPLEAASWQVNVSLEEIRVHDRCDGVSAGDWIFRAELRARGSGSGGAGALRDWPLNTVDVHNGDVLRRPPLGVAVTVSPDYAGDVEFVMWGLDCENTAYPESVYHPSCPEGVEEFGEVTWRNRPAVLGTVRMSLPYEYWLRGGVFDLGRSNNRSPYTSTTPENVCGGAYSATVRVEQARPVW